MPSMPTSEPNSAEAKMGRSLGLPLLVIATAQLMLVLDDSIANIALPTIQKELGISPSSLPWVINAYILAFGGLLLFGGRIGDLFGRRRALRIGMALFTAASLLAGLAASSGVLIAARGLQGIGAALTAPNVLALIATTFPNGKSRNKALAVYGAMSGLGIVAGLLLGGLLTGLLGWRWVFFINVPIGLAVLAGTNALVDAERHAGNIDIIGAATSTGGMAALIYAITSGGEHGWSDSKTLGALAIAASLLPLFVFTQARAIQPLLPLRLFNDRNRTGSYLAMLLLAFGPMGTFYLLTLYMQHILVYSPVKTGLAWLPFGVGIVLSATLTAKLVTKFPPRAIAVSGMLICATASFWLSYVDHDANYAAHVMPAIFLAAFGFGTGFVPLTLTAVNGVQHQDAGIASALLNAAQQIGVALGLAVLSTVSVTATADRLPNALAALYEGRATHNQQLVYSASDAVIHGYANALAVAALFIFGGAVITALTINAPRQTEVASALVH